MDQKDGCRWPRLEVDKSSTSFGHLVSSPGNFIPPRPLITCSHCMFTFSSFFHSCSARPLSYYNFHFRQLEDQESLDTLPPCLYMLYDDVRTVVYRNRTQLSRKAVIPSYSVKLWLDQIKDEGDKSTFKDEAAQDKDHYLLAWCTRFQLKVYGLFVCIPISALILSTQT